jgi:hypothetical protein
MKSILAGIAIAVLSGNAAASLIEQDFVATGDKNVTFDSFTGLKWLDLTLTSGLSYNQILQSEYVTTYGYRFATPSELLGLYSAVGISPGSSADRAPGVKDLLNFLGCNVQCTIGWPAGQGWLDMGDSLNTAYAFFQLGYYGPGLLKAEATLPSTTFRSRNYVPSIYEPTGGFLVTVSPVPESYAMLLIGAGVMGFMVRRRKNTQA